MMKRVYQKLVYWLFRMVRCVNLELEINHKKDLKYLVKDSQTPKGLNEQAVKQLRKAGFYRDLEKSLNSILKRLNRV